MTRPRVLHLIDDTTAGGVMRVLDHIVFSPLMAANAIHAVQPVHRGAVSLRRLDADIVVSHLSISWATLPALVALRLRHPRTPLVHVEHSYTERFVAERVARKGRFTALLRTGFALFDRIVAVSEGQAAWIRTRRLAPAARLTTIASCVDLAPFRALPPPPAMPLVIGAIGRLDPQKGFDLLIRAFRDLRTPGLALHIHGDGPEAANLRALARGDGRILFKGWSRSATDAMAGVDAVVMPSRWEAFGLVAIEALAAGRPVLTSGVDGLSDHLRGGAQTVADATPGAWADAMARLGRKARAAPSPYRQHALPEQTFARGWGELVSALCPAPR